MIETVLSEYAALLYSYAPIQSKVVFACTRVDVTSLKENRLPLKSSLLYQTFAIRKTNPGNSGSALTDSGLSKISGV